MKSAVDSKIEAELHNFEFDPAKGIVHTDDDGFTLEGWYYRFVETSTKNPIGGYYGPYRDEDEAHTACLKAWETEDY